MNASEMPPEIFSIPLPLDYFGDTRSSLVLWPEKILCFTRSGGDEMRAEPLERHHHHRYVLVTPWRGRGDVYVDDRRFTLDFPRALLIFPFQFHHGFRFGQTEVLWQFITFETRDGAMLEALRLNPVRSLQEEDFSLLASFAEAWINADRKDELAPWLMLILTRMLRAAQQPGAGELQGKGIPLLMRINQECMPHLHRAFGLKDLAARLAMSESYLRTRFRQEAGISLGKHLRRLRLQKAIGMLCQSDISITQVAERCGFDSVFAFSRSFRQFAGISAREYRQRFAER